MTEQELLDFKQEITETKEEATKLEGRKDLLLEQLKEKYGVTTIKQAKATLKKMEKGIMKLDDDIKEHTEKLEQKIIDEQTGDTEDED